ncbi:ABC transporter ATP-binding protein [Galactobacter sp.]|uniref:ATP-binding cassette domain-containing protein n=1 Tax=Galactobacter sp. TaxID=2676125 RepID=UPI0025B7E60E|nr:ABC transporter ATP-binding protein [Galactobacter sp.]
MCNNKDARDVDAAQATLEVRDLCISIGASRIVSGLSFSVRTGERICLLGTSGSGKSLTASAILGLLPAIATVAGSIQINGEEVCGIPLARRPEKARAAMVFQDSAVALNPLVRLREQLVEPLRRHGGLSREDACVAAVELAESVGLPDAEALLSRYSGELSGGQRQRICIALALACDTSLLIADEPTTALDVVTQQRVLNVLRTYTAGHAMPCLLFITHDVAVASQLCTHAVVMHRGRIVETGAIDDVLAHPGHAYTRHLVTAAAAGGNLASAIVAPKAPTEAPKPDSVLRVRELTRTYTGPRSRWSAARARTTALAPTSFDIGRGERVGVLGSSGSGKTTLLQQLLALDLPDSGTIEFDGRRIEPGTATRLRWYRRRVQYIPQDPASTLDPLMPVSMLVAEPLKRLGVDGDHGTMVLAALESVGLNSSVLNRRAGEISGGQAQRVAIARAIVMGPELLLADEPVSGLDLPLRQQVVALLRTLSEERGMGLIVVSHDLSVVADLCDRTMVMSDGHVVEDRTTTDLLECPEHRVSKELVAAIPRLRDQHAALIA